MDLPPPADSSKLACAVSDGFVAWLAQSSSSLAISTYQANKVLLVGWDGQQPTLLPRNFEKPMGMAVRGEQLALATRNDLILFANAPLLAPDYQETQRGRYDSLFLPRLSYHTGDLNIHDIAWGSDGLWLVNTRFCCLSRLDERFNFVPAWKPSFVSDIVPEDRCHLNGLAIVEGKPRYVTCLGATDTPGGWRPHKATGGLVLDVESGQTVASSFAMPHSPRWHQGKLWLLNSGAGELCQVDVAQGKFEVVCALPGYLRGLCLVGDHALIGLCKIREQHIFGGLPVQTRFPKLISGVALVNLKTGRTEGLLEFVSGYSELFEIQLLPGIRRPMILNLEREAARQAFTAPQFSYWLRPSNEIPLPKSSQ